MALHINRKDVEKVLLPRGDADGAGFRDRDAGNAEPEAPSGLWRQPIRLGKIIRSNSKEIHAAVAAADTVTYRAPPWTLNPGIAVQARQPVESGSQEVW
jgi:hypothetical protein